LPFTKIIHNSCGMTAMQNDPDELHISTTFGRRNPNVRSVPAALEFGESNMTMKSSLFAISMMAIGATFAGQAMAGQYSESASERIAEANRAAAEPHVPGVFAEQPPISAADTLNDMVQYDGKDTRQTASANANKVNVDNGGDVDNFNYSSDQ
jgi:hypothetical protein